MALLAVAAAFVVDVENALRLVGAHLPALICALTGVHGPTAARKVPFSS